MRIIIYGIGGFYSLKQSDLQRVLKEDFIVAYADVKASEISEFNGRDVLLPSELNKFDFDYVVVMSIHYSTIFNQLIQYGISPLKIKFWDQYEAEKEQGTIDIYGNIISSNSPQIAIISTYLDYNGGSLAALFAGIALQRIGYAVQLVAPGANTKIREEILKYRISVAICKAVNYPGPDEISYINSFDYIIVNVFQMIGAAYNYSVHKPLIWWIHECSDKNSDIYPKIRSIFFELDNREWMQRIHVATVSNIAKEAFEKYYPNIASYTIPIGIPDNPSLEKKTNKKRKIFSIIGSICELKGQDLFVDAVEKLSPDELEHAEFWLVGDRPANDFTERINSRSQSINEIKILGVKTREEMRELFSEIDVVVCASREETMSMTIVEGMMNGKICITTNHTGVSQYINHGVNGFTFNVDDTLSLSRLFSMVISDSIDMKKISSEARRTYEKYFSLKALGENIRTIIENNIR